MSQSFSQGKSGKCIIQFDVWCARAAQHLCKSNRIRKVILPHLDAFLWEENSHKTTFQRYPSQYQVIFPWDQCKCINAIQHCTIDGFLPITKPHKGQWYHQMPSDVWEKFSRKELLTDLTSSRSDQMMNLVYAQLKISPHQKVLCSTVQKNLTCDLDQTLEANDNTLDTNFGIN